jgi:polysaccharide export outer membrane protein
VFYVIGDVNRPGAFEIPSESRMLVSQALATSGGPTKTAKASKGVLIRYDARGTREERPVDFAGILRGKKPDFEVMANDVIFVPGAAAKTLGLGLLNIIPTLAVAPLMF